MASTNADISIGLNRMSSVCEGIAWAAASISRKLLDSIVTVVGLTWRIALTTVKPSPEPGICGSVSNTPYRWEVISLKPIQRSQRP
jgi:hypothetical protein